MPISNPASFFVNGHQTEKFEYEGGSTLYHFSPYDSGLSSTLEMNIMFGANGPQHAISVVQRMLEFCLDCIEKYPEGSGNPSHERSCLHLLDSKDSWVIVKAPTNQVYKIGWADNDRV